MKMTKIAFVLVAATFMAGCAVVETVNQATSAYHGVQNIRQAKAITESEPIFLGMEAFRVDATLHPDNPESSDEAENAFRANLVVKVDEYLRASGLDIAPCVSDCPTRSVVIQFRETGWDRLVDRWTFGRSLRGELYFIEAEFGAILERVEVSGGDNYGELSEKIIAAAMTRAMASVATEHREAVERGEMSEDDARESMMASMETLNAIDPVHSDYRPYLLASR